jgi:glycosyltransferase involved in cell wall biosynthesis
MNSLLPDVSVCMITYNHENYIEEAIKGVLAQNTTYSIELIIANDASVDATGEIIETILNAYNGDIVIRYKSQDKNVGMMPNFIEALHMCQGKYIALCEGDDYWIDELKLQKQVDFLEQNLEFSYCGHQSQVLDKDVLTPMYTKTGILVLEDVIVQNILNTASLVIRQSIINKLPALFENAKAGDWMLQLIALKDSNAYVLEDIMSVYRKHDTSVWSSLSAKEKGQLGVDNMKLAKSFFEKDEQLRKLIDEAILLRQKKFGIEPISILKKLKRKFLK